MENDKSIKIIKWIAYIVGYALVLVIITHISNSMYLNLNNHGLYAFIAVIIIYILNKTIKPILVILTLPLTLLTYGLFYPLINVIILYITSFILGDNFTITGIIGPFFASIGISFLNMLMDGLIIKPFLGDSKWITYS